MANHRRTFLRHQGADMPQPDTDFPSEIAGEACALRSLARALTWADDADDLTQDALVIALTRRERPQSLRPWLRRVLRNQWRATARREYRRRAREQASPVPEPPSAPDDTAARAELVAAVQDALRELDEAYREVLQARFFADRTAADIARAEGCNAGTVRWRLQEGLRRVRRKLDERFDGRSQWLGGMACIAGAPLPPPPVAITTGAPTMTKSILLKIVTATAVVAGASALALQIDGEADTAALETPVATTHSAMQATVASASTPEAERADAERLPVMARIDRAAEDEDEPDPGCAECDAGANLPSVPMLESQAIDCFDGVSLGDEQFVDLQLELSADADEQNFRIEAARLVDERLRAIDGLERCVTAALDDAVLHDLPPGTRQIQLSLFAKEVPSGVPIVDGRAPTVDADAADPEAMAKKLGIEPRGSDTAVVSIVECTDYDCPFCKKARETVDRIVADYGDAVAVYELSNPLPFHEGALPAARAAIAAGKQGKYWEMADLVFDHQDRRNTADFQAFAAELGLDVGQFQRDFDSEETTATIEDHRATCSGNGARGVPSFFINGDLLVGAQPYERFKAIIDDELAARGE
jgi:RNA polymerase sigma factor (sigma-70 family)